VEALVGAALVLVGASSPVLAEAVANVPEINPASISGALAIVGGGLLLLRASRKRK
jgi:hypothetical protein